MSNTTLHPASQNLRVDINDECASPGTMWVSVISCGSHVMSKLHVWVDLMVLPFGNVMVIGFLAIRLLVTGAFQTRKWPVAPNSKLACLTPSQLFNIKNCLCLWQFVEVIRLDDSLPCFVLGWHDCGWAGDVSCRWDILFIFRRLVIAC